MIPTADILRQWKGDMGLEAILDWIRCNAHLYTSLDAAMEQVYLFFLINYST